jgi:hypothetical protein
MKKKDLMSVALVAVGTATLTVAGFWANPIEAGGGADGPATAIAGPKLVADGVEFTLTPAQGRVFQTGDQPAFELHAVNTVAQTATVKVYLGLDAAAPASMFSRAMPIATEIWREEQLLTFKANESRTVLFQANTNLPANRQFFVSLAAPSAQEEAATTNHSGPGQFVVSMAVRSIMALTFSTIPPKPVPTPVTVLPAPGAPAGGTPAPAVAASF